MNFDVSDLLFLFKLIVLLVVELFTFIFSTLKTINVLFDFILKWDEIKDKFFYHKKH